MTQDSVVSCRNPFLTSHAQNLVALWEHREMVLKAASLSWGTLFAEPPAAGLAFNASTPCTQQQAMGAVSTGSAYCQILELLHLTCDHEFAWVRQSREACPAGPAAAQLAGTGQLQPACLALHGHNKLRNGVLARGWSLTQGCWALHRQAHIGAVSPLGQQTASLRGSSFTACGLL